MVGLLTACTSSADVEGQRGLQGSALETTSSTTPGTNPASPASVPEPNMSGLQGQESGASPAPPVPSWANPAKGGAPGPLGPGPGTPPPWDPQGDRPGPAAGDPLNDVPQPPPPQPPPAPQQQAGQNTALVTECAVSLLPGPSPETVLVDVAYSGDGASLWLVVDSSAGQQSGPIQGMGGRFQQVIPGVDLATGRAAVYPIEQGPSAQPICTSGG